MDANATKCLGKKNWKKGISLMLRPTWLKKFLGE
jgi:hypothetical protein